MLALTQQLVALSDVMMPPTVEAQDRIVALMHKFDAKWTESTADVRDALIKFGYFHLPHWKAWTQIFVLCAAHFNIDELFEIFALWRESVVGIPVDSHIFKERWLQLQVMLEEFTTDIIVGLHIHKMKSRSPFAAAASGQPPDYEDIGVNPDVK